MNTICFSRHLPWKTTGGGAHAFFAFFLKGAPKADGLLLPSVARAEAIGGLERFIPPDLNMKRNKNEMSRPIFGYFPCMAGFIGRIPTA